MRILNIAFILLGYSLLLSGENCALADGPLLKSGPSENLTETNCIGPAMKCHEVPDPSQPGKTILLADVCEVKTINTPSTTQNFHLRRYIHKFNYVLNGIWVKNVPVSEDQSGLCSKATP